MTKLHLYLYFKNANEHPKSPMVVVPLPRKLSHQLAEWLRSQGDSDPSLLSSSSSIARIQCEMQGRERR
jgi:hypothetical protein